MGFRVSVVSELREPTAEENYSWALKFEGGREMIFDRNDNPFLAVAHSNLISLSWSYRSLLETWNPGLLSYEGHEPILEAFDGGPAIILPETVATVAAAMEAIELRRQHIQEDPIGGFGARFRALLLVFQTARGLPGGAVYVS